MDADESESFELRCVFNLASSVSRSKFQSRILVVATRTFADFDAGRRRVEVFAGNAVKGNPAAFAFKARVVATVIVKPQPQKHRCDKQAVDDDRSGQGEHGIMLVEMPSETKRRIFLFCKAVHRGEREGRRGRNPSLNHLFTLMDTDQSMVEHGREFFPRIARMRLGRSHPISPKNSGGLCRARHFIFVSSGIPLSPTEPQLINGNSGTNLPYLTNHRLSDRILQVYNICVCIVKCPQRVHAPIAPLPFVIIQKSSAASKSGGPAKVRRFVFQVNSMTLFISTPWSLITAGSCRR